MIAKWIVCRTSRETREDFSRAQRAWQAISGLPGFRGQLGGFSGDDAHLLSLWRDAGSLAAFMGSSHDVVVDRNRQSCFYSSIRVDCLESRLEMPGRAENSTAALRAARFLRLADCTVRIDRVEYFLTAQREIWTPGMAAADGFLAGAFWSCRGEATRFVVTSLWVSDRAHAEYVETRLPDLKVRARPQQDLVTLDGYRFLLEDTWTVLADPSAATAG